MNTIKYRKKPGVILCYEALFRNLKKQYRSNRTLVENYNRFNAGYRGEKEVDYQLKLFPHKNFLALHNVRLKIHNFYFQIDTLIISEKVIFILETKNLAGIIKYDAEWNQLVQYNGEKQMALQDPILQAETQKLHLQSWLQQFHLSVPIEFLVVSSNPSTIIKVKQLDPEIYQRLIRTESLPLHINKLSKKYRTNTLKPHQIKKITNTILQEDTPLHPNLIHQYHIKERHLERSIFCPICKQPTIVYAQKMWKCSGCSATSKSLHERYILDYFLLFGDTITNSQCRKLCQVDSPRTAYHFLQSMNLPYKGNNKGRVYLAPKIDDFPQDSDFPGKHHSILDMLDYR